MIPIQYYTYPFNQYLTYSNYEYMNLPYKLVYCSNQQIYKISITNTPIETYVANHQQLIQRGGNYKKESNEHSDKKENMEKSMEVKKKNSKMQKVDEQKTIKKKKEYMVDKFQMNKDGRNANSNLLRIFFRVLQQRIQDKNFINYIITKNKMKIDYRKFTDWLQINSVEHRNYIRLPFVKNIFFGKKSDENAKIMRILLKDFLQNDAHSFYLTSKKIKRASMRWNYHSFRTILQEIQRAS